MLHKKHDVLGPITYEEKSILACFGLLILLWFTRQPEVVLKRESKGVNKPLVTSFCYQVVPGWGNFFPQGYVTDGTASILVAFLLFVLPAENPFRPASRVQQPRGTAEEYRTIMTWQAMREKFSWSTLLLLGGGYAMALGVESSGLSDMIGAKLSKLDFLPNYLFIAISCCIVVGLTEFSSNVATASIFIPMVASIVSGRC